MANVLFQSDIQIKIWYIIHNRSSKYEIKLKLACLNSFIRSGCRSLRCFIKFDVFPPFERELRWHCLQIGFWWSMMFPSSSAPNPKYFHTWLFPPFLSTSGFTATAPAPPVGMSQCFYEDDATAHLSDSASRTGLTGFSVPLVLKKSGYRDVFIFLVPIWYRSTESSDNTNSCINGIKFYALN